MKGAAGRRGVNEEGQRMCAGAPIDEGGRKFLASGGATRKGEEGDKPQAVRCIWQYEPLVIFVRSSRMSI